MKAEGLVSQSPETHMLRDGIITRLREPPLPWETYNLDYWAAVIKTDCDESDVVPRTPIEFTFLSNIPAYLPGTDLDYSVDLFPEGEGEINGVPFYYES